MQSNPNSLNFQDIQKWLHNLRIFLAPVGLIYLAPIIASLASGGVITRASFVPSPMVEGAIILYVLNGAYDLLNKWKAGN